MQYIPFSLAVVLLVAFLYERKRRREAEKREKEAKKKHQAELIAKLNEVNARFTAFEKAIKKQIVCMQEPDDYPKGPFIEF